MNKAGKLNYRNAIVRDNWNMQPSTLAAAIASACGEVAWETVAARYPTR